MNEDQQKLFEKKLEEELSKARSQGLAIGCKSVSQVVYDKVKNVSRKSTHNDLIRVIKDIKKFCETGLAIKTESSNSENNKNNNKIVEITEEIKSK